MLRHHIWTRPDSGQCFLVVAEQFFMAFRASGRFRKKDGLPGASQESPKGHILPLFFKVFPNYGQLFFKKWVRRTWLNMRQQHFVHTHGPYLESIFWAQKWVLWLHTSTSLAQKRHENPPKSTPWKSTTLRAMFEKKISHKSSKNRAHFGTKPLLKRRPLMVPRGAVPDKTWTRQHGLSKWTKSDSRAIPKELKNTWDGLSVCNRMDCTSLPHNPLTAARRWLSSSLSSKGLGGLWKFFHCRSSNLASAEAASVEAAISHRANQRTKHSGVWHSLR